MEIHRGEVTHRTRLKGKETPFPECFGMFGERGSLPAVADSTGAGVRHLTGMTIRMRWNGQGFGDLPVKSGGGVNVSWVTGVP